MNRIALVLLALCLTPGPLVAELTLERSVPANGGGAPSSDDLRLDATCGQAAVGVAGSVSYVVEAGFWHAMGAGSAVPEEAGPPARFELAAGLVGADGGRASIAFAVPRRSPVAIRLYDPAGRAVRLLADGDYDTGWHRAELSGRGLSSGVYFCRMEAEGFAATRRVVWVR